MSSRGLGCDRTVSKDLISVRTLKVECCSTPTT